MNLSPLSNVIPSFGAPTLEGFDTSNVQDGQRLRGSNRQLVRFYKKQTSEPRAVEVKENPRTGEVRVVRTEIETKDEEFILIVTPGDKNEIDQPATDWHKREFWKYYTNFRDGKSAPIGKDIDECSYVAASIATELRYLGVHTEEQLADASDMLCNQVANGWELREFAKAVCTANNTNKSLNQVKILRSELESSRAAMAEMAKEMEKMKGMILDSRGSPVSFVDPVPDEPEPEEVKTVKRTRTKKEIQ